MDGRRTYRPWLASRNGETRELIRKILKLSRATAIEADTVSCVRRRSLLCLAHLANSQWCTHTIGCWGWRSQDVLRDTNIADGEIGAETIACRSLCHTLKLECGAESQILASAVRRGCRGDHLELSRRANCQVCTHSI
jgi:hypothetical protein